MNALIALVRPFIAIVAHKAGPEDLPASRFLLGLVLAIHLVGYLLGMLALDAQGARVYSLPVIDVIAQSVFFATLLGVMGFSQRLLQTLTAAFGADAILNLVSLPLALLAQNSGNGGIAALASLGAMVVLLWSLGVKGHILQRAVGLPYFVGVLIALAFLITLYSIDQRIFGV